MYQHSVFGAPLPIRRQVSASGCTWTLSTSWASRNLISSGNGSGKLFVPAIASVCCRTAAPRVCPWSWPLPMVDLPSGRSAISQLSPIFSPAGKSLPKTSRSLCPPQIRGLSTGIDFSGYISMVMILPPATRQVHAKARAGISRIGTSPRPLAVTRRFTVTDAAHRGYSRGCRGRGPLFIGLSDTEKAGTGPGPGDVAPPKKVCPHRECDVFHVDK